MICLLPTPSPCECHRLFTRAGTIWPLKNRVSHRQPPSLVIKLDRRHTGRLRKRVNLLTGEGGGAKSCDAKKAWSSINHSIVSSLYLPTCFTYQPGLYIRHTAWCKIHFSITSYTNFKTQLYEYYTCWTHTHTHTYIKLLHKYCTVVLYTRHSAFRIKSAFASGFGSSRYVTFEHKRCFGVRCSSVGLGSASACN